MILKSKKALFALGICMLLYNCSNGCYNSEDSSQFIEYAESTLDTIYAKYGVPDENLLREYYPSTDVQKASYLNTQENLPNKFSYLWPYSGTLSATIMLYKITKQEEYLNLIESKVIPGLNEYYDTERYPFGYASYISRAPQSDRFYDDNIWIGIDFVDLYMMTNNSVFLEKAEEVWNFVYSGFDEKLGGGIYWVEQDKKSKHSCSNAPAAVLAAKLYSATQDPQFLEQSKSLYQWTKSHLQDADDHLYCDNINLEGKVDSKKYSYNSGQMLQAAVLLFNETHEESYLKDAQQLAKDCHEYFFTTNPEDSSKKIMKDNDMWFTAIMARGFVELYHIDNDPQYIKSINASLRYAWSHLRNNDGLFTKGWNVEPDSQKEKWLLSQAAMVEMYARFSCVDIK